MSTTASNTGGLDFDLFLGTAAFGRASITGNACVVGAKMVYCLVDAWQIAPETVTVPSRTTIL